MIDQKNQPNPEKASAFPTEPEAPALRWPWWTQPLPPDPTIVIKFDGLLAFCYDDQGCCEVGVLKGTDKHQLKITVKDLDTNTSQDFINEATPETDLRLEVTSPLHYKTKFLKAKERREDLDPTDPSDRQDFRWMLDLEDHIYDHAVAKVPGCYRPKFHVTNGIFYTEDLTTKRFRLIGKESGAEKDVRHLAHGMAANIYLDAGGSAQLTWGALSETFVAGKKYEVSFTYLCVDDDGNPCTFSPGSLVETERHDFHFYFDTFNVDPPEEKFTLMQEATASGGEGAESTDAAPCGPLGYGRSSGFG